jgi:putative endonuclease
VRKNYRTRRGEIDLIMRDGSTLVFVEVRYRSRADYVAPEDTVGSRKRARLIAAANQFLDSASRGSPPRCRFDVVSVTRRHYRLDCRWIKDAFTS